MPECRNALWPCAMTGAVTCFAGIRGIGTIIHGPSGCYFFPATILHRELHCTFLIEEDIIFGAEERLLDLVRTLQDRYGVVAVVNTCTRQSLARTSATGSRSDPDGGQPGISREFR